MLFCVPLRPCMPYPSSGKYESASLGRERSAAFNAMLDNGGEECLGLDERLSDQIFEIHDLQPESIARVREEWY